MLTELTFCRESSINISIDNRYYHRLIHIRRLIFPVNHNGASVYNPDHIWDRACACYTREALVAQSATWVSDHRSSTVWWSYCSVNPLHLQNLYFFPAPSACWYKLNSNRFNDHERLNFSSQHRPPAFRHFLLTVVIAGDCAMALAFHVLQKICRTKISLQFISTFGRSIVPPLEYLGPVTVFQ